MKKMVTLKTDVIFYISSKDINSATSFFIEMLKEAFFQSGLKCVVIHSLANVNVSSKQLIVTINIKEFVFAFFKKKQAKTINWFQGVVPEELGQNKPSIYILLKRYFYTLAEWFTLRLSVFNIFVSKTMLTHYQKKYKYNKQNYIIIPCFNQEMKDWKNINKDRYIKPTFVYAGNLAPWQCIEETIQVYKKIEDTLSDSELIILTAKQDQKTALSLIMRNGIQNYQIKYVPLEYLDTELQKYKYGFILRKNSIVNNVATPTKMNSYIANGLIPIYSNVIGDFKNIFRGKNIIDVPEATNLEKITAKILIAEKRKFDPNDIYNEYSEYISKYYNRNDYINELRTRLNTI